MVEEIESSHRHKAEEEEADEMPETMEKDSTPSDNNDVAGGVGVSFPFNNLLAVHLEELKPEIVPGLSGPISPAILDDNWMFNCGKWVTTDSYLREINGAPLHLGYAYEPDNNNKSWEIRSEPLEIINFLDHLKPDTVPIIQFGENQNAESEEKVSELVDVLDESTPKNEFLEELKPINVPSSLLDGPLSPIAVNGGDGDWLFNCGSWQARDDYLQEFSGRPGEAKEVEVQSIAGSTYGRSDPIDAENYLDELRPDTIPICVQVPVRPQRRNHVAQPPKDAKPGEIVNVNGQLWRDGIVIREVCCEPMEEQPVLKHVTDPVKTEVAAVIEQIVKAPEEVKSDEAASITIESQSIEDEELLEKQQPAPEEESSPEEPEIKEENKSPSLLENISEEETPLKSSDKTPEIDAEAADSGWVFVESGWVNTKTDVVEGKLTDPSAAVPAPVESLPIDKNNISPAPLVVHVSEPEQFLDFLQPHTIPSSLDDLLLPVGEFYDDSLTLMKPVNIPRLSNKPVENAKLANGWEFAAGSWFNPHADNESLLDSAGRPSTHEAHNPVVSALSAADVELLERECPFESDYLMELKPLSEPAASTEEVKQATKMSVAPLVLRRATSSHEIELPAPEVELLSADQFVCVMTYDAESQQIVCGMPISKEAAVAATAAEAVQVQSENIEDATVTIYHQDVKTQEDDEEILDCGGESAENAMKLSTENIIQMEKGDEQPTKEEGGAAAAAGDLEDKTAIVNQSEAEDKGTIIQNSESMEKKEKEEIPESSDLVEVTKEDGKRIENSDKCPLRVEIITMEEQGEEEQAAVTILQTVAVVEDNVQEPSVAVLQTPPTPSKRYTAPIFENLLPRTPITVVKLGISGDEESVVVPAVTNNNCTNIRESAAAQSVPVDDDDNSQQSSDNSSSEQIAAVVAKEQIPEEQNPQQTEEEVEVVVVEAVPEQTEEQAADEQVVVPGE